MSKELIKVLVLCGRAVAKMKFPDDMGRLEALYLQLIGCEN
jgi:hypothetical protein